MLDTKTNFVDEKVEIDPKDLQVSFGNNTTETKDKETKEEPKAIKVSLGNDSEALAEEKSKPKDKQDKDKIKQLEKSIKDREKEIKDQVKNNKKYKPDSNTWNGVIDDKNSDDWSYIANNWKIIPQSEDFKHVANKSINKDITNVSKDREYYLNLSQRGFEEWNGMQENPDDPDNYKKWEEENKKWKDNAKKTLFKYIGAVIKPYLTKYEIDEINPAYVKKAYKNAVEAGDYDSAVILHQVILNDLEDEKKATENEKAQKEKADETATNEKPTNEKPTKEEEQIEENQDLRVDDKAPRETSTETTTNEKPTKEEEQIKENQDLKVGGKAPRETLNEAQSKVSKNIKDLVLDETYQTLTDDEKRDALKKATEKALNEYSLKFIDKVTAREDAAQLSKFLPRFAIQHYLEGDFGERKTPKSLGTLGYFLLDKVGKSLVNASQVARGLSPTERTVLEDYNKTMLENAFDRDNENRKKILMSSIDTLIKDSDVLRELGISDFKIFDNFTEKVLTQYQDNIQNVNLDKILQEKADFIDSLPEKEKNKYIGYVIATGVSEPGSAEYLIASYREAKMALEFAKTDAEKYAAQKSKMEIDIKLAGMKVNNDLLSGQLDSIKLKNEKDRATMAAEIEAVVLENKQLIEDIKKARTENEYLAKEKEKELEQKVASIVSTYAAVGTHTGNTVAAILDAIIPG